VLTTRGSRLSPTAFDNGFTKTTHPLKGELFSVTLRDKTRIGSDQFRLQTLDCERVEGHPDAARAAERRSGMMLTASLMNAATGLHITWQAVLRDGANYLREEMRFESASDIDLAQVALPARRPARR
jgi:hypothetical protein